MASDDYMDFGADTTTSESEHDGNALLLVQQYLKEHGYSQALSALEDESRTPYEDTAFKFGGRLQTILDDYASLKALTKFGALDLADKDDTDHLLTAGDGVYAKDHLRTLESLHSANILSVRFSNDPSSTLIATGSTDRTLKITDYTTGTVKSVFNIHTSPILSLDFHPTEHNLLLTTSMDGSHCLVDINSAEGTVQHFRDHSKYVVRTKWHPDGELFATASYDKTVGLYRRGENNTFSIVQTFYFNTNVEALCFSLDGSQLLVAVREDNNIYSINLQTLEKTKLNMNANGDDHVSFSAMDINATPDGRYYLVSTDKDRMILYKYGSSAHVRSFYGATNDEMSQPRNSIAPSGQYVYSTSQDNQIYVWDLALQKVVNTFKGHTSVVRDIHYHPTEKMLASCSFDKKVVLWN